MSILIKKGKINKKDRKVNSLNKFLDVNDSAVKMNEAVARAREELGESVEVAVNVRDKSPVYKDKLSASRLIFDISKGKDEIDAKIENKNYYFIQMHNSLCGSNPLGSDDMVKVVNGENVRPKGKRKKKSVKRLSHKQQKEESVS